MSCEQSMARPKESIPGFAMGLYSANKLRKMGSEFESLRRSHELSTAITLDAISGIVELQSATMYGIIELSEQLTELSKISWDIKNYFERKEAKEDFIGDLKMILIKFEVELDSIDKLSEEYIVYATLQVESIQELVKINDVRIEHFKTLSFDDIYKAKGILERIDRTYLLLRNKLEDADLMIVKEFEHLKKTLSEIKSNSSLIVIYKEQIDEINLKIEGTKDEIISRQDYLDSDNYGLGWSNSQDARWMINKLKKELTKWKSEIAVSQETIISNKSLIEDLTESIEQTYESIKHLIPYSDYL